MEEARLVKMEGPTIINEIAIVTKYRYLVVKCTAAPGFENQVFAFAPQYWNITELAPLSFIERIILGRLK